MLASRLRIATVVVMVALPGLAHAEGALDPYLPKSGTIAGHVMTFAVAPEDQAISKQFRSAVQNNMDWFKKAVTGGKAGQPLPYDHRMGITEAQYVRLQHMKADFTPGAAVTIAVQKAADGTVRFASKDEPAKALTEVSFPPDETVAVTPFGRLAIFNAIHAKDPKAPIGVWDGAEWAQVKDAESGEPSAKIAFGKRADGGGVMYYQVAPYKDHAEQSLVVFYGLE